MTLNFPCAVPALYVSMTLAAAITCSSIECPNGYIPIPDAQNTPCDDGECTRDQCCDAFCWGHACPNGYIPNPRTVNDECPLSGCTDDLCCVRG